MNIRTMLAILCIVVSLNCVHVQNQSRVKEPLKVALKDGSRLENAKIRHIFRELFLNELLARGKGTVIIYDDDSLAVHAANDGFVDYYLVFDLMDYALCDVERERASVIVSLKIDRAETRIIENSYVASVTGNGLETICRQAAVKLADLAVRDFFRIQRNKNTPSLARMPDSL